MGALLRQQSGSRLADAAAGAGYQGNFTGQVKQVCRHNFTSKNISVPKHSSGNQFHCGRGHGFNQSAHFKRPCA